MNKIHSGTRVLLSEGTAVCHTGFVDGSTEPQHENQYVDADIEVVVKYHWTSRGIVEILCDCPFAESWHLSCCQVPVSEIERV